jgi:protein phosphatase
MTSVETVEISSYSLTHIGKVRKDNQDAVRLCDPNDENNVMAGHLYGIADGMGGYAHGGVASALALETFFETFYSVNANGAHPRQKLRIGMENANLSVYQAAQRMGAGNMGTTITVVNIVGRELYIGHVGDSRAYLIRDKKSTCLTNDHTRVGELVRVGILSPEKIRTHAQRSVLDKCLGISLFIQPDIFKVPVQNNDMLILCTDGVWSVIEDDEFAQFANRIKEPDKLSNEIINTALDRNSDDNLSIVVLHLHRLAENVITDKKERKIKLIPEIVQRFFK